MSFLLQVSLFFILIVIGFIFHKKLYGLKHAMLNTIFLIGFGMFLISTNSIYVLIGIIITLLTFVASFIFWLRKRRY